jgi:transcriptional regulator with XRE-family HTH domain
MNIMVRQTDKGISYAPLYVHSFQLVQPHFHVDAEKYNMAYSDLSEIESMGEKLRWCRYRKGLLQREVAEIIGIDRGTYVTYEDGRDLYPLEKIRILADLYGVPIISLLDEYNLFLYKGQGKQIKALRKTEGMTQKQFAEMLGISMGTLKEWENDKANMFKSSWEKFFKDKLAQFDWEKVV